ncbi:unnamed protein product [Closterium sp. NIES-64]|nr:unnamed protein product [Closterium sp. NIES-64]
MTTTTSITRAVPLAQRPFDAFFVLFFAVHVLTAVLIDAQMLLPRALFPEALRRAVTWHVETSGDFLVAVAPSLVSFDLLLPFPFNTPFFPSSAPTHLTRSRPRVLLLFLICSQLLLPFPLNASLIPPQPWFLSLVISQFLPPACSPQPWFLSLVISQFLLHVPFFLVAIYAFCTGREWIRVPAIAYSGHAITNMCIPPCTVLLSLCRPWRPGPAMSLATPSWPTATSCSTAPSCALCHLLLHRPFLCPLPPPAPPPLPVPTATSCSTAPSCALCHLLLHRPFLCPLPPPAPPPLPVPSATLSQARPHSLYPHIPILSEIALNPKPLVHPSVAAGHLPPLLALPFPFLSEIALSSSPWSTRQKLLAVYLPFLAVPCLLLARVTLPSSLFHKKFVHAKKRL